MNSRLFANHFRPNPLRGTLKGQRRGGSGDLQDFIKLLTGMRSLLLVSKEFRLIDCFSWGWQISITSSVISIADFATSITRFASEMLSIFALDALSERQKRFIFRLFEIDERMNRTDFNNYQPNLMTVFIR